MVVDEYMRRRAHKEKGSAIERTVLLNEVKSPDLVTVPMIEPMGIMVRCVAIEDRDVTVLLVG